MVLSTLRITRFKNSREFPGFAAQFILVGGLLALGQVKPLFESYLYFHPKNNAHFYQSLPLRVFLDVAFFNS